MQTGNGRPILLLIASAFACAFMYGFFTKVNIEFVTSSASSNGDGSHLYDKNFVNSDRKVGYVDRNTPGVLTVVLPLEEIKQREREKAVEPLLKEKVPADDKRLVQAIRDHFIDPPSTKQPKNSNPLVDTPQAKAVMSILNKKTGGFYIECGALDGERSSNTIYLERRFKWNGILIEMDPSWYRQLEGKNRKAYAMNACLSPHQYATKMDFQESSEGMGKVTGHKTPSSKLVYCFPLLSVMLAMNQTHIDYFSLDVEGVEMDILKTIPFDRLDITTFSVEYEHATAGGRQTMIDFMQTNGYTLHSTISTEKPTWVRDFIFVKKRSK